MEDKERPKVLILDDDVAGLAAARKVASLGVAAHVNPGAIVAPLQTKEEELATVDPKLQEGYEKLSEADKIALQRAFKTFKRLRNGEYKLVDNIPFAKGPRGPKFTPKKKKRKK